MSDLLHKHCEPCEGGVPALPAEKIQQHLREMPKWQLSDDGYEIQRAYQFANFHETMAFVNAVAWVANVEGHHPDMEVGYDYCRLRYSTHAIGALTENDFICAAKIDALLA